MKIILIAEQSHGMGQWFFQNLDSRTSAPPMMTEQSSFGSSSADPRTKRSSSFKSILKLSSSPYIIFSQQNCSCLEKLLKCGFTAIFYAMRFPHCISFWKCNQTWANDLEPNSDPLSVKATILRSLFDLV